MQLHKLLPPEVVAEVKDLLRKSKAAAGATPYKDLKVELMKLYGPRPEDAFDQALALVMTGKPSTLCKAIINKRHISDRAFKNHKYC